MRRQLETGRHLIISSRPRNPPKNPILPWVRGNLKGSGGDGSIAIPLLRPAPAREARLRANTIAERFGDIDIYLFDQLRRGESAAMRGRSISTKRA